MEHSSNVAIVGRCQINPLPRRRTFGKACLPRASLINLRVEVSVRTHVNTEAEELLHALGRGSPALNPFLGYCHHELSALGPFQEHLGVPSNEGDSATRLWLLRTARRSSVHNASPKISRAMVRDHRCVTKEHQASLDALGAIGIQGIGTSGSAQNRR